MSIAVFSLITWLVIIVFAIVPKRFTLTETVFLYFVSTIMTVAVFTIFDINLQWVLVSRNVEKSFALNICRFIEIPLLLILSAEVLNSSLRARWRWMIATTICVFYTIDEWMLLRFGILTYRHWNLVYTFLDYGMFVILIAWIARWFVGLDRGGLSKP